MRTVKILVLRGGAIGDFILTLPVFQALLAEWPQAEIECVGYPRTTDLALAGGLIRRAHALDGPGMTRLFVPETCFPPADQAYYRSFDFIISYLYDPDELLRGNLVANGAREVLYGGHAREDVTPHATEFLMKPLEAYAIYPEYPVPELNLGAVEREPCLVIHPGSGSPMKNWPLEKFIELARRVGEQMPVRFNLGEAEQALEAALLAALPEASLIREDALLDTARAINRATHFLGNDTGITHLAAALGLDVTVLFGPSDPRTWAPRGKGRVTVLDRMETRSVDEVVAACMG